MKTAVGIVLTAVWCCFIFFMSANTGDVSQGMSDGVIASVIKAVCPGFAQMSLGEQAAVISAWSFPVRKAAHFTEYALLGVLAAWDAVQIICLRRSRNAAGEGLPQVVLKLGLFALAWLFCVLFAAGDEFHQLFVDGRSGQPVDVLIDSCGALAGVIALRAVVRRR